MGEGHNLRTYLANGGGEIATYDNSSTYHRTNSGSGYYTENYCSVSSARLEIQYTILQSSLTTYPSSITINKSNSYTISSSSPSYKHKLTLSIAGETLTLLDGVARGTHSFTAPTSWAKNFPNASSANATLILETKDGNTSLGTNTYSNIVVKVDGASGVNPVATINSITTKDSYAISGSSQIKVSITGTAKEGASIKTYTLKVGSSSYTYTSAGTKTITASGSGAQAFSLEVIDSRGLSSTSSSITRYITNYVAPALKTGAQPLQRVDGSGNASIQGKYYSFTYTGVDYCNIVNFSTGSNIANSVSITITINGVTSQITSSPWRSTREYAVDQSYTATVKVTDLRTTVVYTFDAPSASYLIHFLEQKNSVGIGCAAEALANGETGKITMGWPVYFKGNAAIAGGLAISGELQLEREHPLAVACGGTGATTEADARESLGINDVVSGINESISDNATNISTNATNIGNVSTRVGALEGYAHIKDIQMGLVYNGGAIEEVKANSYKDYTVTFPRAFTSAPFVMCCFEMDSTVSSFGRFTVSVKNDTTTTTGFTFRVYNGSSEGRYPRVRWLAIQMA